MLCRLISAICGARFFNLGLPAHDRPGCRSVRRSLHGPSQNRRWHRLQRYGFRGETRPIGRSHHRVRERRVVPSIWHFGQQMFDRPPRRSGVGICADYVRTLREFKHRCLRHDDLAADTQGGAKVLQHLHRDRWPARVNGLGRGPLSCSATCSRRSDHEKAHCSCACPMLTSLAVPVHVLASPPGSPTVGPFIGGSFRAARLLATDCRLPYHMPEDPEVQKRPARGQARPKHADRAPINHASNAAQGACDKVSPKVET